MNTKQVRSLKIWLNERGADVLSPTSEYELVRFKCSFGTGVVYFGKKGISYNCEATQETVESWRSNTKWRHQGRSVKNKSKNKPQLIVRDGHGCFYCGLVFDPSGLTVEHVVSRTHGGVDKLVNMVLACKPCNDAAGTLSVIEKVKLRETIRSAAE